MAIQVRRGRKVDFDPDKMLPGEWAVSTDNDTENQIVWMCFEAGVVKRMGTYEEFTAWLTDATTELGEKVDRDMESALQEIDKTAGTLIEQLETGVSKVEQQYDSMMNAVAEAEETGKKAGADAANALETAASLQNVLDVTNGDVDLLKIYMNGKIDDAYVEDGYLYLTSSGEIVAGPLGPFSGTGGGGSGGNNAELSVQNTSGWLSKTVAQGGTCEISFQWSSLEDGLPTGGGTLKITVNGIVRETRNIAQGQVTVDLKDMVSVGSNAVKANVTDVYGNSRTINYSISVVAISISSTFDASTAYTGAITFPFTPVGNVAKTIYFMLDGRQIGTVQTSISGRQQSYVIPSQGHGAHKLSVYFTADIGGESVKSNTLYYEIICTEAGNDTPIIASDFQLETVPQYTSISVPYIVYDPSSLNAEITLSVNGEAVSTLTVDRNRQMWTYRADSVGELMLKISCKEVSKEISINVTESEINVEAVQENLELYLTSYGRSNNEENPGKWSYENIEAELTGFNFVSDGWKMDKDNITVLRVAGDSRVNIPFKIFEQDFRTTGKTIEMEFSTRDIMDYDAEILSCMSGGRGISLTAQQATLRSEQSSISTQYKEDEHVRVSFVIEKHVENRLIYCYINGVMSGVVRYPESDDFSQTPPVGISIGSNDCTIDLYCIRVYKNDLTRQQVLENWIADTQNVTDMLARYQRNNVFDEYGRIVINNLPKDLPYLVFEAKDLPTYKGDKKEVNGSYTDPVNDGNSFTFEAASADVQGTSSAGYARKNYKVKFPGFIHGGNTEKKYALRPGAIPVSTFTFKADVASSEGANNVELARLYNDICPYRTPPQEENPAVRQGIDGFPIVIFQNDGEETNFIGRYNFNNDKGTEETFGFSDGDESWEVLNNTSPRVLWKSADFEGEEWLNDFEGRYPDGNEDPTKLSELARWLVSTDQEAATNEALPEPASYGEVQYDTDTAAYRLAKFKAELSNYCEIDGMLFNYLFTELFLMVDNRAKNAFPTKFASGKWTILPYDYDTAIGTNNEGALVFDYSLEDIDQVSGADVYNGQKSVLWVNLRQAFGEELAKMYQTLRSDGKLSYEDTERRFEEHQAKWPEAIFNEDSWYKYLAPLVESGNASYLSMLQGSKAEQRKWWLYNRFRYIDSKYNAGDALSDFITLRAYQKADITITPYADIYASVKYGSYLVQKRALRGSSYTLECPVENMNDTETYIYSCSQLKSVGDLSGLMVGYADFSMATKLQSLKLGDSGLSYSNENLKELYLGNNNLLRTLDVRNCPNLAQTVDVSGCTNLEHVYFDNTSVPGVTLPNGGILKTLHLPGTVTNLTVMNQTALSDFSMPSYENITTLRLENVGSAMDEKAILEAIQEGSRVRLIGFSWEAQSAEEILELYALLDKMRGLDEAGNNTEKAQLGGTIHVESLTGTQLAEMNGKYPNIEIRFDHITSYLKFYNYDGTQLLYTATVTDGGDGKYSGSTPTRASTAQYTYRFVGWSKKPNSTAADPDALTAVTADRDVYAAFEATVRTYTVSFYNESVLLQTVTNVPYGGSATYTEETPTKQNVEKPEDYEFTGWSPEPTNITKDTSCYAQFRFTGYIEDDWDVIAANVENGTYKNIYGIHGLKLLELDFGDTQETIEMEIADFDHDDLADGSGKAGITFIAKQLLAKDQKMRDANSNTYGWERSYMRTYCDDTIYNALPEKLKQGIKTVKKISDGGYSSNPSEVVTEDKVWIPSYHEVGFSGSQYAIGQQGKQYDIFTDSNSRKRFKKDSRSAGIWWLRSSYVGNYYNFWQVNSAGSSSNYTANGSSGVLICFCIGKAPEE